MNWFFGCQMFAGCCRLSNDFVPMTKLPDVGWVVFLGCFVMETLQVDIAQRPADIWQAENQFIHSSGQVSGWGHSDERFRQDTNNMPRIPTPESAAIRWSISESPS